MNSLIKKICEDKNWNKWIALNSIDNTGCISKTKNGCISEKRGCISITHAGKSGCIS